MAPAGKAAGKAKAVSKAKAAAAALLTAGAPSDQAAAAIEAEIAAERAKESKMTTALPGPPGTSLTPVASRAGSPLPVGPPAGSGDKRVSISNAVLDDGKEKKTRERERKRKQVSRGGSDDEKRSKRRRSGRDEA